MIWTNMYACTSYFSYIIVGVLNESNKKESNRAVELEKRYNGVHGWVAVTLSGNVFSEGGYIISVP